MASQVDKDNPWPWLDAFGEEDQTFFNGRGADIVALHRCVQASAVTVLFSRSGLGKTSLLGAGLFPRLREERLLPVHARLHAADDLPPMAYLLRRLEDERARHGLSWRDGAEPPQGGEPDDALWLRLHAAPVGLVDAGGNAWQPVLVLDQFEEIFTHGAADPAQQRRLFARLAELIENRIPPAVARAIERDEVLLDHLQLDAQPCRIVVSLREDDLPDLEAWTDRIPRLGPNRCRLEPMSEAQALNAVAITGGVLVDGDTAQRIVRYVAARDAGAGGALRVEPALLSLVCSGLNEERQKARRPTLDASDLDERGGRILDGFYDRAFAGQDQRVAAFVEQALITPDGVRLSYPLGSALREGALSREEVDELIQRRLLRKEALAGGDCIELVHDRVAAVALRHRRQRAAEAEQRAREETQRRALEQAARDAAIERERAKAQAHARRLAEEAQARAEEARQRAEGDALRLRVLRTWLSTALAMTLLLGGVAAWAFWQARQAAQEARAESRASTALRLVAEAQAMEQGSRPGGDVRAWQQLLAAHRLLGAARSHVDADLLAALRRSPRMLRIVETGGQPVTALAFSPDGSRVVSGSDDGTLRLWDTRTGTLLNEPWRGHEDSISSVAFNSDGSLVVSGSHDRTLRLWEASTGAPRGGPWKGHSSFVIDPA